MRTLLGLRREEPMRRPYFSPRAACVISFEEVPPEKWRDQVVLPEIEPQKDKMLLYMGEKSYGSPQRPCRPHPGPGRAAC